MIFQPPVFFITPEKTQFLLNHIDDVSLRQQIEKQLNKVERANKFSKAVFFGNNGEYFYGEYDFTEKPLEDEFDMDAR